MKLTRGIWYITIEPSPCVGVVDDSGVGFTIVGTYVDITVRRGKSTSNINIYNQVYNKQILVNGKHYWQEGVDPFDILIEGLQRGER